MALVGDPELLFLDEPTTGFDPSARRQAWDVIAGLRDLGKTVFLTTHYMDEAQRLADRVTIIAARRDRRPRHARRTSATARASRRRSRYRLDGERGLASRRRPRSQTLQRADRAGARARACELEGLEVTRPSLEDVYLELTAAGGRPERARMSLAPATSSATTRRPSGATRPSVFFTVMFPVVLLLIFATVFGGQTVDVRGGIKTTDLLRAGDHHPRGRSRRRCRRWR